MLWKRYGCYGVLWRCYGGVMAVLLDVLGRYGKFVGVL